MKQPDAIDRAIAASRGEKVAARRAPEPLERVLARQPPALRGSVAKLRRAVKHLDELRELISDLDTVSHYRIERRDDSGTGRTWWEFREIEPLPDEWAVVVGEFAHNLKSALDLAVQQLARSDGNSPGDRAAFPIFSDRLNYEGQRPTYLAGVEKRHWPLFDEVQPFHFQRSELDDLSWLTNVDQHRDLHPRFLSYREGELRFTFGERVAGNALHEASIGAPGQFLQDGALVAYVRQEGSAVTGLQVNVTLDVAFGDRRLQWQHLEGIGATVAAILDDIGGEMRPVTGRR